jgi:MtN3 and saliva related transmembrane protein
MPNFLTVLGVVAGVLTTTSFLPQVIKTWKSRSAGDLSLPMYSLLVLGIVLWICYGVIRQDMPIVVTNAVTLALTATILYFKLVYK